MAEHYKTLVVILGLALPSLWILRAILCPEMMRRETFNRRAVAWLLLTVSAFLANQFWIFLILASIILVVAAARDPNPLGLYAFVLICVPPISAPIPGLGLFNSLFDVHHVRLLALLVLLPIALRSLSQRNNHGALAHGLDAMVFAYVLLQLVLLSAVSTYTHLIRQSFYYLVDVLLVYYAFSRGLRTRENFTDVLLSFVVACLLTVPLALFESLRGWLLYNPLSSALNMPWHMGNYLARGGEDGALRATVSAGHSIVLGYLMLVAITFWLGLYQGLSRSSRRWLLLLGLVAGIIATISRGPWVGAVGALAIIIGIGPGALLRSLKFAGLLFLLLGILALTPYGEKLIDYLPFVGEVDSENVDFRQRLFQVSLHVITLNPWFGSFNYMYNSAFDTLWVGGLLDIVNSYVQVALSSGLVGLGVYVAMFLMAFLLVVQRWLQAASRDPLADRYGRSLMGAVFGIGITIATVSQILLVPTIYYFIFGLCVSYARLFARGAPVRWSAEPMATPQRAGFASAHARPVNARG